VFKLRPIARGTALLGIVAATTFAAPVGPALAAGTVTLTAGGGSERVAYGQRVELAGRAGPGTLVRLEHAPAGARWRAVARTTATGSGSYRVGAQALRSGHWRAVSEAGASTPNYRVTVAARLAGHARRHVLGLEPVRVVGRLVPGLGGRPLRLEVRRGRGWKQVDRARTRRGGSYALAFRPGASGAYRLRVRFAGNAAHAGDVLRVRRLYVYSPGGASWYGPGFYGRRTACGQTLDGEIKGVAHRTLPCGTKVRLFYRGRSVNARVVDRGPYHGSRSWDLTPATKAALRFGSTGTVWASY
jgi:hypothetical protein